MEYDRALYRVYERIMEDLNASPSPLAPTAPSSSPSAAAPAAAPNSASADGGLRRRRRGGRRRVDQGRDDAASASTSPGGDGGEPNDLEETGREWNDDDGDDPDSPRSQSSSNSNDDDDDDRERRRRRRRRRRDLRRMPVLARRQFSTAMRQQRRHQPLPFVLPIWMARKMDGLNHSLIGTRMSAAMADADSAFLHWFWSNVRAIVIGRGDAVPHSSYDSVATSPTQRARNLSTPSSALSLSPVGTTNNHRDESNEDLEEGVISLELPPLNTDHDQLTPTRSSPSEGLRHRSPARRGRRREESPPPHSPAVLPPRLPNSSSSSSSSTAASSSSRQSSAYSGEGRNSNNNLRESSTANNNGGEGRSAAAPARTLAQRAIQTQLRQSERFSSHGRRRRRSRRVHNSEDGGNSSDDSESASSEDGSDDTSGSEDEEDNDDDDRGRGSEGCSQRNLYGAMRLSFAVAVFHVFVLIALHVTYVGPYAFRRQKTTTTVPFSVSRRWRSLVNKVGGERNSFVRGLLLGDAAEREPDQDGVDQKDDATTLFNCISYALSTRPIEDRSAYFGEDKDKSASDSDGDGSGKRFLLKDGIEGAVASWDDDETYYFHDDYLQDSHDWRPQFGNHGSREIDGSSFAMQDDDHYGNDEHSGTLPQRSMQESSTAGTTTTTSAAPDTDPAPPPRPSSLGNLGKDEILQIKIMYGGKCTGRCSRVHKVEYPENASNETALSTNNDGGNNSTVDAEGKSAEDRAARSLSRLRRRMAESKEENDDDNGDSDSSLKQNKMSSPDYWEKVHYRFAIDDALMFLDEKSAWLHNITVVNVTVTERCLSTGSDDGQLTFLTAIGQFLSQIYGMDSIIINQLMYGIRGIDGAFTPGYVKNMETQERWGWHKEQLEAFEHNSFMEWLSKKLGVMLMSTLAFFLITSVTSLIVRVLTSSGVVLMFPLFTCFRSLGMPGADERILSLSYPWIGTARAAIANARVHPQSHLVWAHVTKIILYYVMYEACQAAWSVVLYAKSIPEALPVWIYGFAMIWEYFSMVFVRSALSVHFFPRATFIYFFLYHVYFYSIPYGHFDVALIPLLLFMLHAMLYTILGLEAPNAARGVVNVECPREVYNRLGWLEPVAALPAEWTMFLPLNSRLSPLHDRVSDGAPSTDGNDNGRRENDGNADGH